MKRQLYLFVAAVIFLAGCGAEKPLPKLDVSLDGRNAAPENAEIVVPSNAPSQGHSGAGLPQPSALPSPSEADQRPAEVREGQGQGEENTSDDERPLLLVDEAIFLTQVTDILTNPEEYMDYVIEAEGMYYAAVAKGRDPEHFILRFHPGCCGNDGIIGFQLIYDGDVLENSTWIKVRGHLDVVDEPYNPVRFVVEEMTFPKNRGVEFVTR